MPVYNEEGGVETFLNEISIAFSNYKVSFIVVNDASTDKTNVELNRIKNHFQENTNHDLLIVNNEKNLGHGASVLLGLKLSSRESHHYIITVDGDGQCSGHDLLRSFEIYKSNESQTHECVRTHRHDPLFRKIVTEAVKFLVYLKSGKVPQDGNTPVRMYSPEALSTILKLIPDQTLIPNIHISIMIRRKKLKLSSSKIPWGEPRGAEKFGSSWRQKRRFLPSARFIAFCKNASKELLR
jgi:dolichol-phosphate mannosyltransferase